jgi:putative endonuclease
LPSSRLDGDAFEKLAASHLEAKGYIILDRNVRLLRKEVDIIARDGSTIVFVEVKGRRSVRFGFPSEAVGARKQQHLLRVADAYLTRERLWGRACRFDVVAVTLDGCGKPVFEHIENAFGA